MELLTPEYKPITSVKTSNYFTKDHFKMQIERIKMASEVAQKKMDYYVAHDDNILYAIEIVEQFLRRRPCICYGGQAINEHLPKNKSKFNRLRVKTNEFEKQLIWLKKNNFQSFILSELINLEQIPEKSVVITFDDGYEDNLINAFPLMKKYRTHHSNRYKCM